MAWSVAIGGGRGSSLDIFFEHQTVLDKPPRAAAVVAAT
jgi:hypothetical protein